MFDAIAAIIIGVMLFLSGLCVAALGIALVFLEGR